MLRKIGSLNFLQAFKYGMLTLALPLYLLSKGVDMEEIGLILSLFPLAFLLVRVFSSVIADAIGVRLFFIANSVFNTLTSIVYAFAATPMHFGIGRMGEGATDASFWAVDRTAILARGHDKKYLALMNVVKEFGSALGIIGAGIVMAYFSFGALFAVLVALGIIGMGISISLVNRGATMKQPEWKSLFRIKRRGPDFWKVSGAILLLNISFMLLFMFLLPVMMDTELMMSYLEVALMLTAFYVSMGMGSLLCAHFNMNEKKLLLFQIMTIPFLLVLPYSGAYFPIALMLAGFGFGICFGLNEAMIGYVSEKRRGLSSKVAVLIVPLNLTAFVVFAGAGFTLEALGSEVLFAFSAVLLAGFIVLGKKIMDDFDGRKMREKVMNYRKHIGPVSTRIKA